MALSFLKNKKAKAAPARAHEEPRPFMLAAGIVIALGGVSAIAFFSTEIALLALGFTTLGTYMMLDTRRQNSWEDSISGDLNAIRRNHENLAGIVARQQRNIETLQDELAIKKTAPIEMEAKLRAEKASGMHISNDDAAASGLSDMVVKELVHHAIKHERIDMFIQPIVRLPQRKKRYFEMYARIRAKAGVYLPAERYMKFAKTDNVVAEIDNLLLLRCLHLLKATAHLKKAAPFFVNVAAPSLKNAHFMKDLLQFVGRHRHLAERLVFEMKHDDFEALSIPVLQIIDGLGKLGCSFSLDHVKMEKIDVPLLQKYRIRFIKLNAKKMLEEMATEKRFAAMMRFKRKLESNGIGVIAEKIEDEHTLKELLDYDLNYGQGYLFGKPDVEGAYKRDKAA